MDILMLSGKERYMSAGSKCPFLVIALMEDNDQMKLPSILFVPEFLYHSLTRCRVLSVVFPNEL